MRNPIVVKFTPFNLADVQSGIDAVRDAFGKYLDCYRAKSSRSKHGVMGPVGKILNEVKRGRTDPEFLKGYILRIHELSQEGSVLPEAVNAMESAIQGLVALLHKVPATATDRLIERLDYGLYFDRRKKLLARFEEQNRAFRDRLKNIYKTLEAINRAWETQTQLRDWDDIRYGGQSSQMFKKARKQQQEDLKAFSEYWRSAGKSEIANIEEQENGE